MFSQPCLKSCLTDEWFKYHCGPASKTYYWKRLRLEELVKSRGLEMTCLIWKSNTRISLLVHRSYGTQPEHIFSTLVDKPEHLSSFYVALAGRLAPSASWGLIYGAVGAGRGRATRCGFSRTHMHCICLLPPQVYPLHAGRTHSG